MEYSFIFLILFLIIIISVLFPKSRTWSWVVLITIFCIFAFSHDYLDYSTYENEYSAIGKGKQSSYEVIFYLACLLGNKLGLNFFYFRMVLAIVELFLLNRFIKRNTKYNTLVLALYLIYSAIFDAINIRHFMGAIPMLYGLEILRSQVKDRKSIIKYFIYVIIASLCHSAYWVFVFFLPLSYIKNKYKLISAVCVMFFLYLTASSGLVFKIYALFPIRQYTLIKYMNQSYANLNGILFNCFMQFIYMLPAIILTTLHKRKNKFRKIENLKKEDYLQKEKFLYSVLAINLLFCFLIPIQTFAVNYSRMQRLLVLLNYVYLMQDMQIYPRQHKLIKIGSLIYAFLVLYLVIATSETHLTNVWYMHLKTNSVLQFFTF